MWPRVCEVILALWLLFSPAVLIGEQSVTLVARGAGLVMAVFSAASLLERFRRAYLLTLAVALAAAAFPFFHPPPPSPLMQNVLITALVIAMFAVIPTEAMRPPRGWRELERTRNGPS